MSRPIALRYTGKIKEARNAAGNVVRREPTRSYQGVPARDLTERDIARLSDEQLAEITAKQADGTPPLYVDATPRKPADKAPAEKGKE